MQKIFKILIPLGILAAIVAWFLSAPKTVNSDDFTALTPSLENGAVVFNAGGCASCHSAPDAEGERKLILAGGKQFPSDFGTFVAPNISPNEAQGIGSWSAVDLANAMMHGVSPDRKHYYPAFPYTSYSRMTAQDIVDLHGYLRTLPDSKMASLPHNVGFPFNIRRTLGLWKFMFLREGAVASVDASDAQIARGQYLVEGPGHCSECHTPRNPLGGLKYSAWLAGGPNPDGPGFIPNITPHETGIGAWTAEEIAEYLDSGFTPDFDSAGSSMVDVVENTNKLPPEDRAAIAAYLKAIPALPQTERNE